MGKKPGSRKFDDLWEPFFPDKSETLFMLKEDDVVKHLLNIDTFNNFEKWIWEERHWGEEYEKKQKKKSKKMSFSKKLATAEAEKKLPGLFLKNPKKRDQYKLVGLGHGESVSDDDLRIIARCTRSALFNIQKDAVDFVNKLSKGPVKRLIERIEGKNWERLFKKKSSSILALIPFTKTNLYSKIKGRAINKLNYRWIALFKNLLLNMPKLHVNSFNKLCDKFESTYLGEGTEFRKAVVEKLHLTEEAVKKKVIVPGEGRKKKKD